MDLKVFYSLIGLSQKKQLLLMIWRLSREPREREAGMLHLRFYLTYINPASSTCGQWFLSFTEGCMCLEEQRSLHLQFQIVSTQSFAFQLILKKWASKNPVCRQVKVQPKAKLCVGMRWWKWGVLWCCSAPILSSSHFLCGRLWKQLCLAPPDGDALDQYLSVSLDFFEVSYNPICSFCSKEEISTFLWLQRDVTEVCFE